MTEPRVGLLDEVARYYGQRLAAHGETPGGVDWNGEAGQHLRFAQLARVFDRASGFSVNDLGCGYGALVDFLRAGWADVRYAGFDVSSDMVAAATRRYRADPAARFACAGVPDEIADFGVASGIFNVRQARPDDQWLDYIHATLDALHETSQRGFAFNCLTRYSDADRMRPDLFYADPCALFDRCKQRYARDVALLHDYGLYEFTILVRKTP
ncbi:MAG: methyltransferase domain-containing protein [Rhodocyclaceae bacterium]|nr:methyltransferase domain-containing protein [Rhodocyclaceae bacterium]